MILPPTYPINDEETYKVYVPNVDYFVQKFDNKEFFSYVKLSVEWWMLAIKAMKDLGLKTHEVRRNGIEPKIIPEFAKAMCQAWNHKQKGGRPWSSDVNVIRRILRMSLSKKPESFYLAVTDRSQTDHHVFPLPRYGKNVVRIIEGMLPKDEIPFHALFLRIWSVTGEIHKFIQILQNRNVVVVGPPHLSNLGYKLGIKDFNFVEIHPTKAVQQVEKTKREIKKRHAEFLKGHDHVIYCFVGGSAAMWLITELHGKLNNAFLLDIGRAFDVYYFYDPVKKKSPFWLFGHWLNPKNTAWVRKVAEKDKKGVFCLK